MAPERLAHDDPREWLNRAKSNMALSRSGIDEPGIYLEDLCFDAQQAAEKAIKAVLLLLKVHFPYIHDLAELLTLIESGGQTVPQPVREAVQLTPFAAEARYPGSQEPVTREEYENAVTIAATVVRWAEELIGQSK